MEKTMTMVEFLTKVIALADSDEEMKAFAQGRIDKINSDNEKRRTSQNSKQKENEVLKVAMVEKMTTLNKEMSAAEIGAEMNISTAKSSAMLKQLVESGKVKKEERKVKSKGKVNYYSVVTE